MPEWSTLCSLSGKHILQDEAEASSVTGKIVAKALLKMSALIGRRAEREYLSVCQFTGVEVLKDELAVSEISEKRYRIDEQVRSVVSGKTGHRQEFTICCQTGDSIAISETERCEFTGKQCGQEFCRRARSPEKKYFLASWNGAR